MTHGNDVSCLDVRYAHRRIWMSNPRIANIGVDSLKEPGAE